MCLWRGPLAETLPIPERQMKVIQSIHANAKILAAAFKKMTSLRAVFGKKMEVIPCDIECA
jgi:hypothetical protein